MTESADHLVVDIVRTLEDHGLPRDAYQLGREVDPEAVERVVRTGGSNVEVRLLVRGISLAITSDGVRVIGE